MKEKKINLGKKEKSFVNDAKPDEKERCVICWKETEYSKNTPIKDRQFYMEGAGQLCEECYKECLLEK